MSNMRIRNMFLLVTALAVMFLLGCGGGNEKNPTPEVLIKEVVTTATPEPTLTPEPTSTSVPTATPHPTQIEYLNQGVDFTNSGDYQSAIVSYTKAIEVDSDVLFDVETFVKAHFLRALVYSELEQYDKAIWDYNHYLSFNPSDANAYLKRGDAYVNLEQYDKAIDDYTQHIVYGESGQWISTAYNNRGIAYDKLGQYEKALKDFDKTLEIDPNQQYAINNRIRLLEEHPELKP